MKKKGLVAALAALACCFSIGGIAACSPDTEGTEGYTGFKEGYATHTTIGDTALKIEDLIDVEKGTDFTLIATNGVETIDLTKKSTWAPEISGEWTLTLTINSGDNKGTYEAKIQVNIPYPLMTYNTNALAYEYGSTITFDELIDDLRIDVNTINGWEPFIDSLRIDKTPTDTEGVSDVFIQFTETDTEYTFVDYEQHHFVFGIRTDEGKVLKAIGIVNVRQTDAAATRYCKENDVEVSGYRKLNYRNGVLSTEMAAGTYTGSFQQSDLPYVAFKGEYGADSYVSVDFTGKNIPQTAFFCDSITGSLTDKMGGFYVSHGTVTMTGGEKVTGDHSCLTYFGPKKMQKNTVNTGGSFGREGWASNPHPASREGLQEGVKYRYIVGYTDLTPGTADKSGERGSLTLRMLLVNLDTNEILVDMTKVLKGNEQTGLLTAEHFAPSNIVLYANYGITTTWDNVRLVQKNVDDIYDLYPVANFKSDAPEYAIKNEAINPEDFVSDALLANGKLYYAYKANDAAAEGEQKDFASELTIDKAGAYRITYVPNDENVNARSMMLYANDSLTLDFEDGVHNALQGDFRVGSYLNTTYEKYTAAPLNGEKSALLRVGNVLGLNWSDWGVDLEYLDRVFADENVENVVLKMMSNADVYAPMTYQTGNDGGRATFSSNGTMFKKDQLTFITITRANYEKAKEGNTTGKYLFRFYASGASINTFYLTVDDITVGKVLNNGVFLYQEGVEAAYTFQGAVEEFYFNNRIYTPDQTDSGVRIVGNKVSISSALFAEVAGQTVQYVAKTTNGMEISEQTPISSVNTSILYYAEGDDRNSGSKIAFDVVGAVQSVKVGEESVAFTQKNGTVSIYKKDLVKYADGQNKTIAITTKLDDESEITLNLAFQGVLAQLPSFETESEILPFKTENMGAATIVDNTGMKVATSQDSTTKVWSYGDATGKSYKIELSDIKTGSHKIIIPLSYLEEIFATPSVDVFRYNLALSYEKEGAYITGKPTSELKAGFHVRYINRGDYETLKASGKDYVITIDAASHAGSVEYVYLDNFYISGTWNTTYMNYDLATVQAEGLTLEGFYGEITEIKQYNSDVSVITDFTVNGNSITLKPEKYGDYVSKRITITTDQGVSYLVEIRIKG